MILVRYPNVTTKIEDLDYSKAPPNDEQRLLRHILRAYDKSVRPVYNASSIVRVAVGLTLTHIFNVVHFHLIIIFLRAKSFHNFLIAAG